MSNGFAVSIQPGCNDIEAVIVLTAAILAFPSAIKEKIIGLVSGYIAIQLLIAYFIILLAQTWGISFDITRHLLFEFNGVYAAHFEFSAIGNFFVSLGSQLGFLILPSLVPIILWAGLENRALREIIKHNKVQDSEKLCLFG